MNYQQVSNAHLKPNNSVNLLAEEGDIAQSVSNYSLPTLNDIEAWATRTKNEWRANSIDAESKDDCKSEIEKELPCDRNENLPRVTWEEPLVKDKWSVRKREDKG